MTIYYNESGNMFDRNHDLLINPVNTVGVMGKGLALQFKGKFPKMFTYYQEICKKGLLEPGSVNIWHNYTGTSVALFATKEHWRNPSKYEWIFDGLLDLCCQINLNMYRDIGIPKIGCGLGGLDWGLVKPMISAAFIDVGSDCEIHVYG